VSHDPVQLVRDALETRGCNPRGSAGQFMALCPAHEDRDPSLSVGTGSDGRALVNCFAGCETGAVLGELGLCLHDLFPHEWPGDLGTVRRTIGPGSDSEPLTALNGRAATEKRGSVVIRASDVRSRRVKWCWKGRWPIGYLAIQTGEEKLGKSLFFAWAASELTNGRLPGEYYGRKAPILIAAVEDSLEDMWKPRLKAAGADLDLISFLAVPDTGWNIRDGVGLIETALDETSAVLVFVDAVMEHLPETHGGENANSTTFVRGALRPLALMSERRLIATLTSTHPPKGRATGFADLYHASRAFTQVSRSLMVFGLHPDDAALPFEDRRRVLLRPRSNVGRDPGALSFMIGAKWMDLDDGDKDEIPYVGEVQNCDVTIQDLLRAEKPQPSDPEQQPPKKVEQLKQIISDYLADGEWHPSLRDKLHVDGWTVGTIVAAAKDVTKEKGRDTMNDGWYWRLEKSRSATPAAVSSHSADSLTLLETLARTREVSPGKLTLRKEVPESSITTEESKSQSSATTDSSETTEESKSQDFAGATHARATDAATEPDDPFIREVLRRHGGDS
jgi:hypothetical protein